MPRLPRYVLPGQPQHVVQRGNNRCPIFTSDEDYTCFHEFLHIASTRHCCHIHAYVFMTNHIHLLVTPDSVDSIAKTMQSVGRSYVQYFNRTHQRTGTLWEGRYKATIIDTEQYLFTCYRYIELNPVRANMVTHPSEYRWSSYRANAHGAYDELIDPHQLYLTLDNDKTTRQAAYREMFGSAIDQKTLKEIRRATQRGWALGSDRFKDNIALTADRRTKPLPRGGDRRSVGFRKQRS